MQTRPPRDLSIPATALETRLVDQIVRGGPISVDHFMQAALLDPDHGYYTTANPVGAQGDFITAPEVHQMFGELIGLWLAQCWIDIGSPAAFDLVEFGPGRGTLMADALRAASRVPGFKDAAQIGLWEINPHLRALQAQALEPSGKSISWADRPADLFSGGPVLLVANEFLDCVPIRQLVHVDGRLCQRLVGVNGEGRLDFTLGPPLSQAPPSPEGTVFERMENLHHFIGDLCTMATAVPVRALFIDYGSSDQFGDSLQAVWRHTRIHPLDRVGQADLTAHVDFGHVRRFIERSTLGAGGARVTGPVTQGDFLRALGIEMRAQALATANRQRAPEIMAALERLTGGTAMGSLFQVICLASGPDGAAIAGFPALPAGAVGISG
ncbi:MAG: SAM-dependent methyltransferase [Hyphomonadaceae bacterium]|nr:SAM-dependent methyltransferase [Hyphomonadaceae bacterium]